MTHTLQLIDKNTARGPEMDPKCLRGLIYELRYV